MNYENVKDRNGVEIHPGDRVSIKTYPIGTCRGTVKVSDRSVVVLKDGSTVPALVVETDDGVTYPIYEKGILKLKNQKK